MIERVTVVKFRVNYGGGNGAGCFEVKVRADTAKFTDVIVTRLRKCSDLIREGKVFVKNKTKVASGVGCSERAVLYFRELLFKYNKKKFSFRRVESEKIGSHVKHVIRAIQCKNLVSLWRDPDDVSHCRILSPDKTEWWLISATLCG